MHALAPWGNVFSVWEDKVSCAQLTDSEKDELKQSLMNMLSIPEQAALTLYRVYVKRIPCTPAAPNPTLITYNSLAGMREFMMTYGDYSSIHEADARAYELAKLA